MANICSNELRVYSEDEANLVYMNNLCFYYFSVLSTYEDDNELHIVFESKWDFPESTMNKIFEGIPNKKDINMVWSLLSGVITIQLFMYVILKDGV